MGITVECVGGFSSVSNDVGVKSASKASPTKRRSISGRTLHSVLHLRRNWWPGQLDPELNRSGLCQVLGVEVVRCHRGYLMNKRWWVQAHLLLMTFHESLFSWTAYLIFKDCRGQMANRVFFYFLEQRLRPLGYSPTLPTWTLSFL